MKKESGKMAKPAKKMMKEPKHKDKKEDMKMVKGMVKKGCIK